MRKGHSFLDNLFFILKTAWTKTRSIIFYMLLHIPVTVLIPLITTLLTKEVVSLVADAADIKTLVVTISILACSLSLLNILNMIFTRKTKVKGTFVRFGYIVQNAVKTMDTDYINIEGPSAQEMLRKSEDAVGYAFSSMTQHIFRVITAGIANTVGLIVYSTLIFSLCPWIVIVLIVLGSLNYIVIQNNINWWMRKRGKWYSIDQKRQHLREKICDFAAAKDIRLYNMMDWFKPIYIKLMETMSYWRKQQAKQDLHTDIAGLVIQCLRDGTAYTILLTRVVKGAMNAGDFIFYFALITQYSNWVFGMFTAVLEFKRAHIQIGDLREFLEFPDSSNRGDGVAPPHEPPEIVFENVSFQYNIEMPYTIRNITFRIKPGEKVALVGLNGAGKTTIVKLLCNFYKPSNGRILIDGMSLDEYNRDALWKTFSVVFQDVHIMPLTIAENIALTPLAEIDAEKLDRAIYLSDLKEKIDLLPNREKTLLVKQVHQDAVDLSGGEVQKLALARALYRDSTIIILDEPTAALDPIAESHQYERYAELTQKATSLYISHRLSSTQFCDKILYLEQGEIIEEGSHQELMKRGGKYAELYSIQSQYYTKETCLD